MTQEDKDLLFKDLCARLPYQLKVKIPTLQEDAIFTLVGICEDYITVMKDNGSCFDIYNSIEVFPFLRPMSSITEEEEKEYFDKWGVLGTDDFYNYKIVDWLNKKMFAYRTIDGKDMFELGITLKAPEGMYK